MPRETELEKAERHVRQAEIHVARQSELVEQLRVDGHDIRQAEQLLAEFEAILAEHKKHVDLIRSEQKDVVKP